jgi:peptide/nickel transport system permease protein
MTKDDFSKIPLNIDEITNSGLGVMTRTSLAARRFRKSKLGLAGLVIVILLYLCAIFADFIAPYDYNYQNIKMVYAPPQVPTVFSNGKLYRPFVYAIKKSYLNDQIQWLYSTDVKYPIRFFSEGCSHKLFGVFKTKRHLFVVEGITWYPLGGDNLGRCLFTRILYGSRISLTVGLVGVAVTLLFGTFIGTISGYYGGWLDIVIQRAIEVLMSFPAIPLWMALAAALPADWSPIKVYFGIITILSLVGWGALARQVRGLVLSNARSQYVRAAQSFGASDFYIITRHLVPSCFSFLIVIATLSIPATILGETALSFLGLGIRSPMTSWGVLLQEAQHVRVITQSPWLLFPLIPVLLTVVSFNFLGDAFRDAISPE